MQDTGKTEIKQSVKAINVDDGQDNPNLAQPQSPEKASPAEKVQEKNNNLQQPHLIQKAEIKRRNISKSIISFMVAIITIGLTIALGVFAARYFKAKTSNNVIENNVSSQEIIVPTVKIVEETTDRNVVDENKSFPNSGFQDILNIPEEKEAAGTQQPTSTASANNSE